MSMSFRAVLAAVSLTALGVAVGVVGDRLWLTHRQPVIIRMDDGHAERFRSMLDSLGLSDSQRIAIDGVLGHYQGNVNQTWQALQPRLQTTMDSARQALRAVLNEEQLAAFDQWLAIERGRSHGTEHTGLRH